MHNMCNACTQIVVSLVHQTCAAIPITLQIWAIDSQAVYCTDAIIFVPLTFSRHRYTKQTHLLDEIVQMITEPSSIAVQKILIGSASTVIIWMDIFISKQRTVIHIAGIARDITACVTVCVCVWVFNCKKISFDELNTFLDFIYTFWKMYWHWVYECVIWIACNCKIHI